VSQAADVKREKKIDTVVSLCGEPVVGFLGKYSTAVIVIANDTSTAFRGDEVTQKNIQQCLSDSRTVFIDPGETVESGLGEVLQHAWRKRSVNDSLGRLFLLVFLVYPGLTSKIFDIFLCRDLGPGTTPGRVLHADYDVDCDETSLVRNGAGALLVGVWPIGVPAILLMRRMSCT
jgi:hypothetical protein